MKILRIMTVIAFALSVCVFLLFYIDEKKNTDTTYPVIQVDSEVLEISISASKEDLLEGVSAYDGKDGDLTSKVLIESISKFIDYGVCTVTYAVTDSDKHVAKNTRTIRYTDYTSPEFIMNRSMVFKVDEDVDIRSIVGAVDCIDGDISDKVSIIATDYTNNTVGVFSVSLQASNSMGDIIYLDLPIYVEEINPKAPTIELSQYAVYVPKGTNPDFEDYISSVTLDGRPMKNYGILLSSNYNSKKEGVYDIHFHVESESGDKGHAILTAIVEE